jgi:hypothetical protein
MLDVPITVANFGAVDLYGVKGCAVLLHEHQQVGAITCNRPSGKRANLIDSLNTTNRQFLM